jgi:hypothetical protein
MSKGILKILDYFRSRFFWQGYNEKEKYWLAKWSVVCRPKDQGSLGIQDLEVKNRALHGKWLFKLLTENEIWQTLLRESTLAQMCCLRFIENLEILISRLALWRWIRSSSHMDLYVLEMNQKLDSGRINGLAMLLFENNIRLYTILCDTKVLH